jgi:hypothetical protein
MKNGQIAQRLYRAAKAAAANHPNSRAIPRPATTAGLAHRLQILRPVNDDCRPIGMLRPKLAEAQEQPEAS